jgi:hypothetical protein
MNKAISEICLSYKLWLFSISVCTFLEQEMSNPWDERPWAEAGNVSETEIFTAVGRASSHWELVEQAIAGLFTIVTVSKYYAPAAPTIQAYSSVASSHNRIQMVRAALEAWLHEWSHFEFAAQVQAVLNECGGWAGRRNDIAHGVADRYLDEFRKGWFLVPGLYNIKTRPLGKKAAYRYNAAIIDSFSERFMALHNRLHEMTSVMGEWHRIAASERERQKIEQPKQAQR